MHRIPPGKMLTTILIIAIGLTAIFYAIDIADHWSVFDFKPFFLGIAAIVISIVTICKDIKDYPKNKKIINFFPTFIGLLLLFGFLITVYLLDQRDNSPSKLYCVTKIVDFNGVSIDFREDGTYKMTSWCLGADCYRGKYTMHDSIITLDQSKIENTIISDRLLIISEIQVHPAQDSPRMDTIHQKSVYQIDKEGRVILDATDFSVREVQR